MLLSFQYADPIVRYAIARNPTFNSLTADPVNPGALASAWSEFSALDDSDRNLTPLDRKSTRLNSSHRH